MGTCLRIILLNTHSARDFIKNEGPSQTVSIRISTYFLNTIQRVFKIRKLARMGEIDLSTIRKTGRVGLVWIDTFIDNIVVRETRSEQRVAKRAGLNLERGADVRFLTVEKFTKLFKLYFTLHR